MGEAKRRLRDRDHYEKHGETAAFTGIVHHVLEGASDKQVVIGPLVHPPLGKDGNDYFMIASCEPVRGFRCDQITVGDGFGDGIELRSRVIAAFVQFGAGRGLVVHNTDDELYMAKL